MARLIAETKLGNPLITGVARVTLHQTKSNTYTVDADLPGNDWILGGQFDVLSDAETQYKQLVNDLSLRYR